MDDKEWIELLQEAKNQGLTVQEVRDIIQAIKENGGNLK